MSVSSDHTPAKTPRKRRLLVTTTACGLLLALCAGYQLLAAAHVQSTDNAYVNGHIIAITPQTAGAAVQVRADDGDWVQAGQPLVEIDPSDARIALANARAELARARQQVQALYARQTQTAADVQRCRQQLEQAVADARARRGLAAQGAITAEEERHADTAVATAHAALAQAEAANAQAQADIAASTPDTHPEILAAQARVQAAQLQLERTRVLAPVAGMIAGRRVQQGQRMAIGETMMWLVPLHRLWVDANFKEVQLSGLCPEQPAEVTVDAAGHSTLYHGHVRQILAGSGAAFALLPAQNATGNWIKVVQRVPVRIELDPEQLQRAPLRIGMSAEVRVDTRQCGHPRKPEGKGVGSQGNGTGTR